MAGNPALGSNPFIGIDSNKIDVTPGPIVANASGQAFQVQTRFELGGLFAPFIVGLGLPYTVTYTYDEIGGANNEGTLGTVSSNTVAGQLVYDASTALNVPGGTLPKGVYELASVVTFGSGLPMNAFFAEVIIEST